MKEKLQLYEKWNDSVEDIDSLISWIGKVQLEKCEAESIKASILEATTEYRSNRLEVMSMRIERTITRSQQKIDRKTALRLKVQTAQTNRRLVGQ